MPEPRSAPSAEMVTALAAAAGFALDAAALDALVQPVAAIYAAIDGLDNLELAETEPAAVFSLPRE